MTGTTRAAVSELSPRNPGEELGGLAAEIRRLRQSIEVLAAREGADAASAERVPIDKNGEPLSSLQESISTLVARIESLSGGGGVPTSSLRVPPQGVRPQPLPWPETDTHEEGLQRTHQLMTYQDILDRYGQPDGVYAGEAGANWKYKLRDDDYVWFQFQDGLVYGVYFR